MQYLNKTDNNLCHGFETVISAKPAKFPNCCWCSFDVWHNGSNGMSHVLSLWLGSEKRNADHAWNTGNTYITFTRVPLLLSVGYSGISQASPIWEWDQSAPVLNVESTDYFKAKEKRKTKHLCEKAQICFSRCRLPDISSITHSISPSSYLNTSIAWFEVVPSSYSQQNKKITPATIQAAVELVFKGY